MTGLSDKPIHVVGKKTRTRYGYRKNGARFNMYVSDQAAASEYFVIVEDQKKKARK